MIILTKLNGIEIAINSDLIEHIEENPDTTIRLINKNIYIVSETLQEVVEKIVTFRQKTSCVVNSAAIAIQKIGDTTNEKKN